MVQKKSKKVDLDQNWVLNVFRYIRLLCIHIQFITKN